MTTKITQTHEGETEEKSIEEYIQDGGSGNKASLLATGQGKVVEETLQDAVLHNPGVVERALEEDDVYYAEIRVPGWFVLEDDRMGEEFDVGHPGATLTTRALVEDYSDGAWRIIAKRVGSMGDEWFNYVWAFVPKSVCTVTYVDVESEDEAWEFSDVAHTVQRKRREERDAEWEEAKEDGWEAMLEHTQQKNNFAEQEREQERQAYLNEMETKGV